MSHDSVTRREKLGFGMGDAANNMSFAAVVMYLSYFYTNIYGISPAAVGTIFIAMRAIDAITDPIMGMIADRTYSRWGRFRPYLLWFPLPLTVSCILMFTTPDWGNTAKVAYAAGTYGVMSLLYTAVNIPYCSLGNVITDNNQERVSCQSYRFVMVGVVYIFLTTCVLPLTQLIGQGDDAMGFQITMALVSVVALGMFMFCFANVRERIVPSYEQRRSFVASLAGVARNRQWLIILAITFFEALQFFMRQGATIYYAQYVMGLGTALISVFMTTGVVASILGTATSGFYTQWMQKKWVFFYSSLLLAAFSVALYFATGTNAVFVGVLFFILNYMHGIGAPISWAMMSDADDYGEWQSGEKNTGTTIAGNLFFLKMGLAASGGITGYLLSLGGYQADAAQQGEAAIFVIVLLLTLIPALVNLLLAAAIWAFGVDDRLVVRIRHDMDAESAVTEPDGDGEPAYDSTNR
ncbi:MFS transporter [Salinisphaera sp. USBA-960]|uniref:MFS transporter n=1 Tax=Salinisphaera orenii TaxID=856731 RepID=UPI000DBE5FB1|nr:MFS transporter [Salifodinibacter halophilus]NNC25860.1 MFS transporter [Salifodinibacter halophilus]